MGGGSWGEKEDGWKRELLRCQVVKKSQGQRFGPILLWTLSSFMVIFFRESPTP